jgi:hypothetical protein
MVSPEHVDEQKPENKQAPSPAMKQQVRTEVEKKRVWLKRVLGVVVPLIGGFASIWVFFIYLGIDSWFLLLPVVALLLGAASALLFRSWWAILVVPIAFALGGFLAYYLIPLVISPNPLDDVGFALYLWVYIGPITVTLGALIGTAIITTISKREHQSWLTTMPKDF